MIGIDSVCSMDSNTVMACVAVLTLLLTLAYHYDENRAKLSCSVVEKNGLFLLKLSNFGRSAAYDIRMKVSGVPVSENPISLVKETFKRVSKASFSLERENSVYYLLMPSASRNYSFLKEEERQQLTDKAISDWLSKNGDEPIRIKCKYNRIRHIKKKIAIRDYLVTGTLNFKNEIADNISDVAKEIAKLPIDGKTRSRFGNRSYSGSPEHFDINN